MIFIYTIVDYLKYYKNKSIDDIKWNQMDNLLCAILAYLPLKTYHGTKNLNDFFYYAQNYTNKSNESFMAPISFDLLKMIKDSKRYEELKISNFINRKDNDIQFGAMTLRIKNETIISYKGTDFSIIGWIENLRISYEYPTYSHHVASEYLTNNVKRFIDKNIYIVGHSKGGNLAMVSAMEANKYIFNKIINVYNFDGPGLRKDEFWSEKYNRLAPKLINILPTNSLVGSLLYNNNYMVVKSKQIAFGEHYPNSWCMFGEVFVEDKLSDLSKHLHETTTEGIKDIDLNKAKESFEIVFKNMEQEYTDNINISLDNVLKFLKNMKNVDKDVRDSLYSIFETLLNIKFIK